MPRYHVYVWTDKTFTVEAEDEAEACAFANAEAWDELPDGWSHPDSDEAILIEDGVVI